MTQSRFFQWSLFFPFLVWCSALLVFSLAYRQGADFIVTNFTTAYRVLVPYLIFVAAVWKLAKNKSYRLLMLMASVLPVAWGVFFTLFYVVITLLTEQTIDKWYILCIMAFWATIVGYLAEIVPFFVLKTFKEAFRGDQREEANLTSESTVASGV